MKKKSHTSGKKEKCQCVDFRKRSSGEESSDQRQQNRGDNAKKPKDRALGFGPDPSVGKKGLDYMKNESGFGTVWDRKKNGVRSGQVVKEVKTPSRSRGEGT